MVKFSNMIRKFGSSICRNAGIWSFLGWPPLILIILLHISKMVLFVCLYEKRIVHKHRLKQLSGLATCLLVNGHGRVRHPLDTSLCFPMVQSNDG